MTYSVVAHPAKRSAKAKLINKNCGRLRNFLLRSVAIVREFPTMIRKAITLKQVVQKGFHSLKSIFRPNTQNEISWKREIKIQWVLCLKSQTSTWRGLFVEKLYGAESPVEQPMILPEDAKARIIPLRQTILRRWYAMMINIFVIWRKAYSGHVGFSIFLQRKFDL